MWGLIMTQTIDLRSDTVTLPSPEMVEAIHHAELGDDVFGDDPTVKRLEALAAGMLGKEAAGFQPARNLYAAVDDPGPI